MFDWLTRLFERLGAIRLEEVQATDWLPLLVILLISCAAAMALVLLYGLFFDRRSTGSDIHRAFPALGMAITAIFICLQFSLPLSLGLLGALSIVRFRTPIKEPEEIGFLMLLIASSICCATLNFLLLFMILSLATVLLALMRWAPWFVRRQTAVASLVITTPTAELEQLLPELQTLLRSESKGATLDAVTDCDGASTATLTVYRGDATALTTLQQKVRALVGNGDVSLFVQRPRSL